jgi:hypothetical protein
MAIRVIPLDQAVAEQARAAPKPASVPPARPPSDQAPGLTLVKQERPERIPLVPPRTSASPYPLGALGTILGHAAAAIERKVQVPGATAAQSVLAAAALAAQTYRDVLMPYGRSRPLSLYFVTVADSGDRKSAADAEALWPVRKREKVLREEYEIEHADWLIRHAAHAAQKRAIEASKGLDVETRTNELRALGSEPRKPLMPLLTAPDPTVEGLARAWADAPAGLGLFSAEGGAFFGGHGMSQDHKLKTAATLSELWDGSGIRRMRAGDGVTILPGRRLAAHLMAQPEAAAEFMSDPMLRGQGFHSRFLVAAPDSLAGSRRYRTTDPEDDAAIKVYGARLLALLERPARMVEGKVNELDPLPLTMSAGAQAAWIGFLDHLEALCGVGGVLELIKSVAAKGAENAARIAGVLTVVEDSDAVEISERTMEDAISLMNWYVAEALRIAEVGRVSPACIKAQRLYEWMLFQNTPDILFRDVLRLGPNSVRSKSEAEPVLRKLIEHGHIEEISAKPRAYRIIPEGAGQ